MVTARMALSSDCLSPGAFGGFETGGTGVVGGM